ncbi:unnamed protein product [Spirodela intermedia]|uniref:Uncharacterized protein n=1 Tax=Spirodela intermedia TaxID=51605 RepID=A0A7I8JD59_SPIIN|nr:unnamed protein product [Spirodela intermedia]CAA6667312.1 unnamed protein product [Spirodela intermedia]
MKGRHRLEIENLTLASQPFRTLRLFALGTVQYLKQSLVFLVRKGRSFMVMTILLVPILIALLVVEGPHEKIWMWWMALGVASSIGLGSGLHTFVLYLGPHIAFFTIKAVQCGRVDLKSATYDTIQLNRGPSWLERNCSDFGPPQFASLPDSLVAVPLSNILPQIQTEAILWGIGTALGELPPYFISKAGKIFFSFFNYKPVWRPIGSVEELNTPSSDDDGLTSALLNRIKHQILAHAQHLNFFTILLLASVPNPLFDLAGILCGQFGIPFWKFFLATLTGKAIIKTHIQTIFIISLCNNQLLELLENELLWMLGLIPGFSSLLPNISSSLHQLKEKYLMMHQVPKLKEKQWNISFNLIWNSVVWLMLLNFFGKIVTSTAQSHLRKQQEQELAELSASEA